MDDRHNCMSVPNIFDYATTELSQDALICWLVACAEEATGVYRDRSLEFISALWAHHRNFRSNQFDISSVKKLSRQHKKIDVYFQAKIDNKTVHFVIEDKKDTLMHSEQLERYISEIVRSSKPDDEIRAIYFKTGHVYDDERERAEATGFSVFDASDIQTVLKQKKMSVDHEILRQYRSHFERQIEDRKDNLRRWNLNVDFVQWIFLKRLRDHLENRRDEWNQYLYDSFRESDHADWIWKGLARWRNTGGGAWTQYRFTKYMHWRLDAGYPLRLRVATEAAEKTANGFDTEIWGTWIDTFKQVQEAHKLPPTKFTRRMWYRKKLVSEGTVGTIDVKKLLRHEPIDEVLKRIVQFHMSFLCRLQRL